jgi:ankyrin repeat protein
MLKIINAGNSSCNLHDLNQFLCIEQESYSYNVDKDLSSTQLKHLFLGYASDGLLKEMKVLLDGGVDIDSVYDQHGFTALMMAAMNGHVKIVKELLDRGANFKMVDWADNKTAYQFADNRIIKDLIRIASQPNQA